MFLKLFSNLRVSNANTFFCKNFYKSIYNIETLYPNSQKLNPKDLIQEKELENLKHFSGYIPLDDLQISYCKSSGPGGQNVNKVNTKVEIRFHIPSVKWITESTKECLKLKEAGRITKDGYLVVTSDKTRKQILNQADCLDKIRDLIWRAELEKVNYTPTQEELDTFKQRQEKAKFGILREKREHSLKKKSRSAPGLYDV